MQNLCKTTMRFSPQRETWRSMARRKSSFTPLVIPRVTVWCLKPWRKERQTKSNHGYLVNYSHLKDTACHLLYIYSPYLSLFNEVRACAMLFLKNHVQQLTSLSTVRSCKNVYVFTALTMIAEGENNVNLLDSRKIYSLNPASREFSLLGERNFFSSLPLLPRPLLPCNHFYKWLGLKEE